MRANTSHAVLFALVSLIVSGLAFAQLSELDRTSVFRDDIVRFGTLVTLCHIPPGNPSAAHTIEVAQAATPAHLAHGDLTGECPFECDGVPSAVGQTGQTNCWNSAGVLIGCGGTGQDGEHKAGVSVEPRFTDNGDGTVTDNLTDLIWLRSANCWEVPVEVVETWNWALQKANALETGWCGLTDGSTAGDWRLPNIRELQSLIDYGEYDPALPGGARAGELIAGSSDSFRRLAVVSLPLTPRNRYCYRGHTRPSGEDRKQSCVVARTVEQSD